MAKGHSGCERCGKPTAVSLVHVALCEACFKLYGAWAQAKAAKEGRLLSQEPEAPWFREPEYRPATWLREEQEGLTPRAG